MGFFSNIYDSVKKKNAEMQERKEFLNMVEEKAKPIRRGAYMQQMLKEVVAEGIAKAKADAAARVPQQKKTEDDFGITKGLSDPYKFLNPTPYKTSTKQKGKKK